MTVQVHSGETEFHFFRPDANRAFVVGDFNNWKTTLPMTRTEKGEWVCRVRLPEGEYRFKYLADGAWYTDYAAFGIEPCEFGYNSVLVIDDDDAEQSSSRGEFANQLQ